MPPKVTVCQTRASKTATAGTPEKRPAPVPKLRLFQLCRPFQTMQFVGSSGTLNSQRVISWTEGRITLLAIIGMPFIC